MSIYLLIKVITKRASQELWKTLVEFMLEMVNTKKQLKFGKRSFHMLITSWKKPGYSTKSVDAIWKLVM